jgi:hypothetical protein
MHARLLCLRVRKHDDQAVSKIVRNTAVPAPYRTVRSGTGMNMNEWYSQNASDRNEALVVDRLN